MATGQSKDEERTRGRTRDIATMEIDRTNSVDMKRTDGVVTKATDPTRDIVMITAKERSPRENIPKATTTEPILPIEVRGQRGNLEKERARKRNTHRLENIMAKKTATLMKKKEAHAVNIRTLDVPIAKMRVGLNVIMMKWAGHIVNMMKLIVPISEKIRGAPSANMMKQGCLTVSMMKVSILTMTSPTITVARIRRRRKRRRAPSTTRSTTTKRVSKRSGRLTKRMVLSGARRKIKRKAKSRIETVRKIGVPRKKRRKENILIAMKTKRRTSKKGNSNFLNISTKSMLIGLSTSGKTNQWNRTAGDDDVIGLGIGVEESTVIVGNLTQAVFPR